MSTNLPKLCLTKNGLSLPQIKKRLFVKFDRKYLILYGLWVVSVLLLYLSIGVFTDVFTANKADISKLNSSEIVRLESNAHSHSPIFILLIQLIVIISLSRLMGLLLKVIGQPSVIGEILAGIVLGPSLFGWISPQGMASLFPPESINILGSISQLGLVFFMFVIGMELDLSSLKSKAQKSLLISHGTIGVAMIASVLLALFVLPDFMRDSVSPLSFILFLGISFSVTAFPILARIVFEKGLHKKHAGSVALSCAAIDDVTAWCLLAGAIAYTDAGDLYQMLLIIGYVFVFLALSFFIIQPFFKRFGAIYTTTETLNKTIVSIVFLVLLIFALCAEWIGVHALFGAFVAGLIMPPSAKFKQLLTNKVEDISLLVLLPLFFAYTGLRTDFTLLFQSNVLILGSVIIGVAIGIKLGIGSLIAFFTGSKWKDAILIGTLLNTRGLMELIVLNIAFEMGVFNQQLFTMLVLMALTTTFLTGPILLIHEKWFSNKRVFVPFANSSQLSVLISFAQPKTGRALLLLAANLFRRSAMDFSITAVHFTQESDMHRSDLVKFEKESFSEIKKTAETENIRINSIYKPTSDVVHDIKEIAKQTRTDLLLMGGAKSLFSDEFIAGKVRSIIQEYHGSFCVFVGQEVKTILSIAIFIDSTQSLGLAYLVFENHFQRMDVFIEESASKYLDTITDDTIVAKFIRNTTYVHVYDPTDSFTEGIDITYDLLIVAYNLWENKSKRDTIPLHKFKSILICKMEEDSISKISTIVNRV